MRWRDVKQGKIHKAIIKKENTLVPNAHWTKRIKAFIVDIFMIYIPILYITAYIILEGKDDFLENQLAIFTDVVLFGFILVLFWTKSGQSPGYKAYSIKVVDSLTNKRPLFFRALLRYMSFLLSGASFFGLFVFIFRKDKRHLHDILSRTNAINTP